MRKNSLEFAQNNFVILCSLQFHGPDDKNQLFIS